MPTIHVNLKDLKTALGKEVLGREERVIKAIRRSVAEHAPRLAAEVIDATTPKPVDRGTYRRSFVTEDLPTGAAFYNYAPHAAIIENGRRPGARMPPVLALALWVFRKGIVKGGRAKMVSEERWQEARSIAFAIARAIQKRGLPAHAVMARINARLQPLVERDVWLAVADRGP